MSKKLVLSRRDFLKLTAAGLSAAGLPMLAGMPRAANALQTNLRMLWWGEQEAPGLEAYLKKAVEAFSAASGVSIETTLQDTSMVIPEFQTASAAGNAPDIQYFWNGIYHMESVWLGFVEALNGLIPDDVLATSNATPLSMFEGKQYRVGWYGQSIVYLYNKEMFDQVGLDAETPPQTWDELLAACDKLKSAGINPIVGGLKDGPWGEWYMGFALTQNLNSAADALNLLANLDWREPKYWQHWAKLEELWKAGFINDDMGSIDLYPGIDLFGAGQGAMTSIAMAIAPKQQGSIRRGKSRRDGLPGVWHRRDGRQTDHRHVRHRHFQPEREQRSRCAVPAIPARTRTACRYVQRRGYSARRHDLGRCGN